MQFSFNEISLSVSETEMQVTFQNNSRFANGMVNSLDKHGEDQTLSAPIMQLAGFGGWYMSLVLVHLKVVFLYAFISLIFVFCFNKILVLPIKKNSCNNNKRSDSRGFYSFTICF